MVKKKDTKKVDEKPELNSSKKNIEVDDEPGFREYAIVLGVMFALFFLVYFSFEIYDKYSNPAEIDVLDDSNNKYYYNYRVGNVTYNVEIAVPISELRKYEFIIEPTKLDILNTISFKFNTRLYSGEDGYVSVGAIKLNNVLSRIFFFDFEEEDFYTTNTTSCTNATSSHKIITFDINESVSSGVYYENNNCIRVISTTAKEMPILVDYFVISLLEDEI